MKPFCTLKQLFCFSDYLLCFSWNLKEFGHLRDFLFWEKRLKTYYKVVKNANCLVFVCRVLCKYQDCAYLYNKNNNLQTFSWNYVSLMDVLSKYVQIPRNLCDIYAKMRQNLFCCLWKWTKGTDTIPCIGLISSTPFLLFILVLFLCFVMQCYWLFMSYCSLCLLKKYMWCMYANCIYFWRFVQYL